MTSSDSIHIDDGIVRWHYVISQYFATIEPVESADKKMTEPPTLLPRDDAADAAFFSLADIEEGIDKGRITPGLLRVIHRVEAMYAAGLLECK